MQYKKFFLIEVFLEVFFSCIRVKLKKRAVVLMKYYQMLNAFVIHNNHLKRSLL